MPLTMLQESSLGVGGLIIWFIVHVLLAIGCANIAERKGYSGAVGAICGFIFGIWAYPVFWLLKDNSYRDQGTDLKDGVYGGGAKQPAASANCWSCGNPYAGRPVECPTCGIRLNF